MRKRIARWMVAAAAAVLATGAASAQDQPRPPYLNPGLPAEARAADLVHRMTLQEKASQLVNHARAIPRLGVPLTLGVPQTWSITGGPTNAQLVLLGDVLGIPTDPLTIGLAKELGGGGSQGLLNSDREILDAIR